MQRIIREEFVRHTVLAVVHELDMVVDGFDRIAVLEEGRLVEFDSPKELLASLRGRLEVCGIVGCSYRFELGKRLEPGHFPSRTSYIRLSFRHRS
jgi:ABC-type multidrug transport system ATPase subunit